MKVTAGRGLCFRLSAVLVAGLVWAIAAAPASAASATASERLLGETINRALRADGPFFTPAERAVIERTCGYAPGEWDGHGFSMINGVFHCDNGRRVDDREMRALVRAASPRIKRRVKRVMNSAEVKDAIRRVSDEATREATRKLDERGAIGR